MRSKSPVSASPPLPALESPPLLAFANGNAITTVDAAKIMAFIVVFDLLKFKVLLYKSYL